MMRSNSSAVGYFFAAYCSSHSPNAWSSVVRSSSAWARARSMVRSSALKVSFFVATISVYCVATDNAASDEYASGPLISSATSPAVTPLGMVRLIWYSPANPGARPW